MKIDEYYRKLEKIKPRVVWFDAGTLLGIFRDGKLIDGDNDIDLSVKINDLGKIQDFIERLKDDAVKYRCVYFNGMLIKIKFTHSEFVVDLAILHKVEKMWGYPVHLGLRNLNRLQLFFYYRRKVTELTRYPLKFKLFTVTADHIDQMVNTVGDYSDYLQYRYGNWKVPSDSWVYTRDDGGFKNYPQPLSAGELLDKLHKLESGFGKCV